MIDPKDKDIVLESLILNETILEEMLDESKSLKDYAEVCRTDILKLERIKRLIKQLQESV